MLINSKTDLYALIGSPVEHSYSPIIHNHLFEHYGLDSIYLAFDINKKDFDNAIQGLKAIGVKGFNITSPFKEKAMQYINNNSISASLIGTVNAIKVFNENLYGYNTDLYGIIKSFKRENIAVRGKKALLFGSGGVAGTICIALQYMGVSEITILNRTVEKAKKISKKIIKRRILLNYGELNNNVIDEVISDVDLVINATSVDLLDDNKLNLDFKAIKNKQTTFYDVIYNPIQTTLLKKAKNHGYKTVNGLSMLVYQALKSFEIWTGIKADEEEYNSVFKKVEIR